MTTTPPGAHRTRRGRSAGASLAVLAACLAVTLGAGLAARAGHGAEVVSYYLAAPRPAWAPPPRLFGLVWPPLYVLMGVAAWRVWAVAGSWRRVRVGLTLWLVQLAVKVLWPWTVFAWSAPGPGLVLIVTLDLLVIATMVAFARWDALAPTLLAPYLVWLLYLTGLSVALWA